jgi:predicted RNA-binding Zn-ribbon protein involved in translation (DUF1610 family)
MSTTESFHPYRHIYPELARERRAMYDVWSGTEVPPDTRPVVFPETCPACGAEAVAHGSHWHKPVTYACGGGYDSKPQIQNHRDVWWGHCPVTKAQVEAEAEALGLVKTEFGGYIPRAQVETEGWVEGKWGWQQPR